MPGVAFVVFIFISFCFGQRIGSLFLLFLAPARVKCAWSVEHPSASVSYVNFLQYLLFYFFFICYGDAVSMAMIIMMMMAVC